MKLDFNYNDDITKNYHAFSDDSFQEIKDKKNRVVGIMILRGTMTAKHAPKDAKAWHSSHNVDGPGEYLRAYVQITRDGKPFGATQSTFFFKTYSEREVYIRNRLRSMRDRVLKN